MNEVEKVNKQSQALQIGNGIGLDAIDAIIAFGEKVKDSNLTSLKKGSDVVIAILTGRELGISDVQAIQNIYPINGRACIGVHILKGLLLKAGISYEVVKDYQPLYQYMDSSKTLYNHDVVFGANSSKHYEIINPKTDPSTYTKGKIQVIESTTPVDWETTITFSRLMKSGKIMTITRSKRKSDYLHLLNKDNWKNAPKDMLMARTMGVGSRDIAADILGGIYLVDEMSDGKFETIDVNHIDVSNDAIENNDEKVNVNFNLEPIAEAVIEEPITASVVMEQTEESVTQIVSNN